MSAPPPEPGDGRDALHALAALYARLDAEVTAAAPRCQMSGRCCDFPTSGHRLMASTLETAYARDRAGGAVPDAPSGLCPWHVEGTCRLRDGRPLGCRVYFCDPAWAERMPRVYETYHRAVRALHERHGVPYRYETFVDAVRVEPAAGSEP